MSDLELGRCSRCGGRVTVPEIWHGIIPPVPTCQSCGATKSPDGPVIQMDPPPKIITTNTTNNTAIKEPFQP